MQSDAMLVGKITEFVAYNATIMRVFSFVSYLIRAYKDLTTRRQKPLPIPSAACLSAIAIWPHVARLLGHHPLLPPDA